MDSKIIYLLSILPFVFGLTLIGDGVHKITKGEGGWISLIAGIVFIGIVALINFIAK